MSLSFKELQAQKAALDAQIADIQKVEKSAAIEQARTLVEQFQLSQYELFGRSISRAPLSKSGPALVKYKDPVTAKTWTGHGKPPGWIVGKDRAQFAV